MKENLLPELSKIAQSGYTGQDLKKIAPKFSWRKNMFEKTIVINALRILAIAFGAASSYREHFTFGISAKEFTHFLPATTVKF